jgi:hypothetical protein
MLLLQAEILSLQIELQQGHVLGPIQNHTHVIYQKK